MIKKDYYALNEIPKRFDISLLAIKALIDGKKITPLFYQASTKLVIGGIDKDRRFVGYGVAEYEGMITIQRALFSKFWAENEVQANFIILDSHIGISNYSALYPFTVPLPNGIIRTWQATPLEELTKERLMAICLPKIEIDYFSYEVDLYDRENLSETPSETDSANPDFSKYQCLNEEMLNLKNSEIFFSIAELRKAGVIISKTPISDTNVSVAM